MFSSPCDARPTSSVSLHAVYTAGGGGLPARAGTVVCALTHPIEFALLAFALNPASCGWGTIASYN